jgi:hypothetical protein
MDWVDIFDALDDWPVQAIAPALDLRKRAADVYVHGRVGYYLHPETGEVAVHGDPATPAELARCKRAAHLAVGSDQVRNEPLTTEESQTWIKVAYAPALRTVGEALNFFPGHYPGGLPNNASPLAAMLTSGLVGAGLGWGAGRLLGAALPGGVGGNLGRTGAVVGGLLGAAPAVAWGVANVANKRSLTDAWPHNQGNEVLSPEALNGTNAMPVEAASEHGALRAYLEKLQAPADVSRALLAAPLAPRFKRAMAHFKCAFEGGGTFGFDAEPAGSSPLDVNIDAMGRTLWNLAAPPPMTATAMGALYAAQNLPDPRSRPGWATGHQLGQLAAGMGGEYERGTLGGLALNAATDYFNGLVGGALLNSTVGTPVAAKVYGLGNAALGVLGAVLPSLLGR